MMQLNVKQGAVQHEAADAIIINLFEGVTEPSGATGAVDKALGGMIADVLMSGDFKGKLNATQVFYPRSVIPTKRVILVGLGKPDKFGLEQARQAAAAAIKRARDLGAKTVATIVHGAGIGSLNAPDAAQVLVEGTMLGLYRFNDFKQKDDNHQKEVEQVTIVEFDAAKLDAINEGAKIGVAIAGGQIVARNLSNQPGNVATPTYLANAAKKIGAEYDMNVTTLSFEECKALGMGMYCGVAQGTDEPPQFIVMEHNAGKGMDTVVLIGKGITFDSGGISIKPTDGMWDMKHDMSGGAAVIGAMQAVGALSIPLHVVGIVPATENLLSGKAFKPGDILRAMNGKTIEIQSTDAEGRLVLGDALCYAKRFNPKGVIDMATLTGACTVALGKVCAGLLTNNADLANKVKAAADKTGERVWELPLWDDYNELIKSTFADMKNTGGRGGGAITAAAILKNFVDFPWVHLDIAGMSYGDDEKGYNVKGATGYGARLCVELLRSWK
jgi:leucyl aminopeptidase